MEICLIVIFLLVLAFIIRIIALKKIKDNNRYCEPQSNSYVAIPSVKIVNAICFSFVLLCILLGLLLFEISYSIPKFADVISWYVMIACIGLNGLYYALMLHAQYFHVIFEEAYIEFCFKIFSRPKDKVRFPIEEIIAIEKEGGNYIIMLKNKNTYHIKNKEIDGLVGSELLRDKMDQLNGMLEEKQTKD